jgi:hypothetical protein
LITFDLQGQLLQCPDVFFSQFWNTHNIYSELDGGVFDALKRDNTLTRVGRALWIWSRFLGDDMVATTSSSAVRCFASLQAGGQLAVFLVNKETSARSVNIVVSNLPPRMTYGAVWALHGQGPADQHPAWERLDSVRVSHATVQCRLDPVSITVIVLGPGLTKAHASRRLIQLI